MTRTTRILVSLVLTACCAAYCLAAENTDTPKDTSTASPAEETKISLDLKDAKPSEVVEELAKQTKEKFLLESTAKARVTSRLEDVSLEAALNAFCKSGKFEWRKLYLKPESKLLEQPDRLAATARLVSGLGFGDLVIAGSSTDKLAIHSEGKSGVRAAEDKLVKELGLTRVYLITNDAAVAAKAAKSEEEDGSKKVDEYTSMSKKQMDMFMEMTPEEREQALVESLNLLDQVGPNYMSAVMQTLLDSDPELLRQIVGRQTQMLFGMDDAARRRMIRMNVESMKYLTPEQLQMLQEDAKAVADEMKSESGG